MSALATPRPRLDDASGLLGTLRQLVPSARRTPLSADEKLQVAERLAGRLRRHLGLSQTPALPDAVITGLPFLRITHEPLLPTPGLLLQTELGWVIALNAEDSRARKTFTLLHELGHLILDPFTGPTSHDPLAERVANHFAACALMPRALLKRDWGNRIQNLDELAERYRVSKTAMAIRLRDIGLVTQAPRGERLDLSADELRRLNKSATRAWQPAAA